MTKMHVFQFPPIPISVFVETFYNFVKKNLGIHWAHWESSYQDDFVGLGAIDLKWLVRVMEFPFCARKSPSLASLLFVFVQKRNRLWKKSKIENESTQIKMKNTKKKKITKCKEK